MSCFLRCDADFIMLSVVKLNAIMLSVVMLNVITLSVVMLNIIMLSVVVLKNPSKFILLCIKTDHI